MGSIIMWWVDDAQGFSYSNHRKALNMFYYLKDNLGISRIIMKVLGQGGGLDNNQDSRAAFANEIYNAGSLAGRYFLGRTATTDPAEWVIKVSRCV